MIKKISTGSALIICAAVFGQVGVNTDTPAATLDIVGKPTETSTMDGIIAPRIEGAQLRAKTYTSAQTGALVYVTLADTAPAGQTIEVTTTGYYYFNGTKWVSTGAGPFTADVRRIGTNHISEDAGVGSNGTSIPGTHNIAIGAGAMKNATDGGGPLGFLGNIAIGGGDQLGNVTSAGNVAIGYSNLPKSTSGTNVAMGPLNLLNATTADANFVVGAQNMNAVTTASSNLTMGASNLNALTTGSNNYVIGYGGLNAVTTQTQNIAIGSGVLPTAVGDKNIGVGSTVLASLGTGTDNVGLGVASGAALTAGSYNTFFGTEAGNRISGLPGDKYTSGSNSLFLGSQTKAQNAVSNQLNIQNYIYGVSGLLALGDFTDGNALIAPSARLDVTQGNVRIRSINTSVGTLTTDRIVVSDTTGVLKTVPATSVDTIVGNEVTNATTNGGLIRAGGGTAASPYTLGLTSGTTTGDLMTWNGTAWVPSAATNIYNTSGTLTSNRTLTQNGFTLRITGTNQSTLFDPNNGMIQTGIAGNKRGSITLIANDNNSDGVSSNLQLFQDPESFAQITTGSDSRGLGIGTHQTTQTAPITFMTSSGSNAAGTEKMRITGEGNIGINVNTPTEKLHSNGNVRLQGLPLNGTTNAIYTTSAGTASATQNQTFTGTRTVVADSNGVLGYVTGLPTTGGGTAPSGSINVGETVSQIYSIPNASAIVSSFNLATYVAANSLPALPVLDGLQINLQGVSSTYYDPRIYNTSSTSQLVSYQSFATQVNENKTSLNNTLAAGSFLQVDSNNIVFWNTTQAEVETTNVQVQIDANTYRWYEFKWWCMEISGTKKIFLSVTRKA